MKKQRMTVVIPGQAPRNPIIAVLKTRKGGAHGPTHKAQRKRDRDNLKRGVYGADEAPLLLVRTMNHGWTALLPTVHPA